MLQFFGQKEEQLLENFKQTTILEKARDDRHKHYEDTESLPRNYLWTNKKGVYYVTSKMASATKRQRLEEEFQFSNEDKVWSASQEEDFLKENFFPFKNRLEMMLYSLKGSKYHLIVSSVKCRLPTMATWPTNK